MLSVDQALATILEQVHPLPPEKVSLVDAFGRILAEEVRAGLDLPPFPNSAMDGYAVRSTDTAGASSRNPVVLEVVEDVPAGYVAEQPVGPRQAIRIMTGAPVPRGTDAIIPVERTRRLETGQVEILQSAVRGQHIRPQGEDVRQGEPVLIPGTLIGPAELGVLASLGQAQVPVTRCPRVALITTGDELVDATAELQPGQIRDSNSYTLFGQVQQHGGIVSYRQRVPDRRQPLRQALEQAAAADLIVSSGGVSVGDYDLVKDVLAEVGRIFFWEVAIKPGKPVVFGLIRGKPLLGLPGNPVSSMIAFEQFVRPALWKMGGRRSWARPEGIARFQGTHRSTPHRTEFVRAHTTWEEGHFVARPTGSQGSGRLSSMLGANSLVVLPVGVDRVREGDEVTVQWLMLCQ